MTDGFCYLCHRIASEDLEEYGRSGVFLIKPQVTLLPNHTIFFTREHTSDESINSPLVAMAYDRAQLWAKERYEYYRITYEAGIEEFRVSQHPLIHVSGMSKKNYVVVPFKF